MKISIREYSEKDQNTIIHFYEDFQDYLVGLDSIKRLRRMSGYGENALNNSLKDIKEKNGMFFVASDEDKIVGFIVGVILEQTESERLEVIPSKMGRVTDLYIIGKYRGKGIGSMLMSSLEKYFKSQDCDAIWIEVFDPNFPARNLYNKLGYQNRNSDLFKKI